MSKNIETPVEKLNKTVASRDEAFNMMSNGTAPAQKGYKDPNRKKAQKQSWKETEASVSLGVVKKEIEAATEFGKLRIPRLKTMIETCQDLQKGSANEAKRLQDKVATLVIPEDYRDANGNLLSRAEFENKLSLSFVAERQALKSANKEKEVFSNSTIATAYRAAQTGFVNADNAYTKNPTAALQEKLMKAVTQYKTCKDRYDTATTTIQAKVEAAVAARDEKSNEAVAAFEAYNKWVANEGSIFHKIARANEGATRFEQQIALLKAAIATLQGQQPAPKVVKATETLTIEERLSRAEALLHPIVDHEPQMPVATTEENDTDVEEDTVSLTYTTKVAKVNELLENEEFQALVDDYFVDDDGNVRDGLDQFVSEDYEINIVGKHATALLNRWKNLVKA